MVSKVNKLNVFLSDLAVLNIKIHNLHWNVVGEEFITIHKLTETLYEMLQKQFDTVAEAMKMQNEMPLVTMADYLENSNVQEFEGRDYSVCEVLQALDADCDNLMNLAKEIRDEADKKDNFQVANLLEEFLAVYAKHSWMIKSMLNDASEDTDNKRKNKK